MRTIGWWSTVTLLGIVGCGAPLHTRSEAPLVIAPFAPIGGVPNASNGPVASTENESATDTSTISDTPSPLPLPLYAKLTAPIELTGASGRKVFVVPGRDLDPTKPPALVTVLHATCIDAKDNCDFLRAIVDTRGILVCPTGNVPCNNGAATWALNAPTPADEVIADTDAVEAAIERPADARSRDVLFGSSAGTFAARNLINLKAKRWRALVLVGGKIEFAPDVLRAAGIRRVLFVAPDFDAAAGTMRQSQKALCAAGIPSRFISLGPHAHGMIDGSETIIAASMDWVMDEADTDECPAKVAPAK
jgi:hypothetical protein